MSSPPDFLPTASLHVLQHRARLLAAMRLIFAEEGYWEVETPLLSRDTCVDAWLDPFPVHMPGSNETWFLQTSPEFGMKRLLAAGATAIYQLTRSFRAGESGGRHNPEFTILEWYRAGDSHHEQMDFTERLVRAVQRCELSTDIPALALPPSIPRLTYDEAFERFAGTKVLQLSAAELVSLARQHRLHLPLNIESDRDGLLNLLLAELVEPGLARMQAVFLHDYPASQSALARVRPDDPPVAERFELYLGGLEICNGYHELTDAAELRQRIEIQNTRRRQAGKPPLPPDSRLLQAMDVGLPASSGVALGIDRLVMWRLGLHAIADVIPFPADRA